MTVTRTDTVPQEPTAVSNGDGDATGVPALDELAGDWLPLERQAHLPSLRNQWGQAHVNRDLTSLSWLALAPYSGGYHTGVLRVGGTPVAAHATRWSPWGVERAGAQGGMHVHTDTRLGYEQARVLWRITLRNTTAEPVTAEIEQELLAPVAHSVRDWGWLYGTPWNAGHHHDYFATERLRAEVLSEQPRQVQLLPHGERWVRLGSPRIPGIQRDEDNAPMLIESELPDHSAPDSGRVRAPGAPCLVRGAAVVRAGGPREPLGGGGTHTVRAGTDLRLGITELAAGDALRFELRVDHAGATGVVVTHGNHPDSLQVALADGRLVVRAGGEEAAAEALTTGVWHEVEARVGPDGAVLSLGGREAARTRPWWDGGRWSASVADGVVRVADGSSAARCAYAFDTEPAELAADGARGLARWRVTLAPGESWRVGYTLEIGDSAQATAASAAGTTASPGAFDTALHGVAERWRTTWAGAFTPGNAEFSGHLPTLRTADADLSRTYYLGALLALYMRNTKVSATGPVFLTGGPRLGPTTTFFWDQSEFARTAAMLEPAGTRAWLSAALAQPYETCHSFDTFNLVPVGNHYAANDHALFRSVTAYLAVTGDAAFLAQEAGGRSVLDHLRAMAYRPRERRASFGDRRLVDFGHDAWELLECVPTYRDAVVSFNAGYAGMLRTLAAILRELGGHEAEATRAEAEGADLAAAVLGRYAGGGRWFTGHPEGPEAIGHVLDFVLVTADMAEDLSGRQREELVAFASERLLDGDWMRALDPADPVAPFADRPDHGAAGAFAAWPGATAHGLCRLGRDDLAAGVLRRAHRATSGAVWGQAMEVTADGSYRVAERGASNRESVAAVAVTEAVIAGLFGIHGRIGPLEGPVEGVVAGPYGELHHVRVRGFAGPHGQGAAGS